MFLSVGPAAGRAEWDGMDNAGQRRARRKGREGKGREEEEETERLDEPYWTCGPLYRKFAD